ncbi:hypothetical protein PspLS_07117 [Pyricularia sp. CBS 133598]|nr:hypothetical protein PspLS_07117 [Pyricularia sp. CBS 133598]
MSTTDPHKTSILDLPGEIQNQILDQCTPMTLIALRITCHRLRDIVDLPSLGDVFEAETEELACRESSHDRRGGSEPRFVGYFACGVCLRLRPTCEFDDCMLGKNRLKWGREAMIRFCKDCGSSILGARKDCAATNQTVADAGYSDNSKDQGVDPVVFCFRCWRLASEISVGRGVMSK